MGTGPVLTTRIEARNGVTSIALAGELDMATAPILDDELSKLVRDGSRVIVLDIRSLRFIDSPDCTRSFAPAGAPIRTVIG